MEELKIFNNDEFGEIRTVAENGKILFCGSDVAKGLGYDQPHKAIERHCKKDGGMKHTVIDNLGREQQAKFITEGDLYRLIVNSKLPSAEKFEKWVFDEVLPSIRKNGMYATDELLDNPDLLIQVATKLKEEKEANRVLNIKNEELKLENKLQTQQIAEFKPKADYMDRILQSKGTVAVSVISKDYGMSARKFNKLLNELKIKYKQGDIWLLYAKYQSAGYTHTKTFDYIDSKDMPQVRVSTEWTQKGRVFLYNLLKENNVLPLIEIQNIA